MTDLPDLRTRSESVVEDGGVPRAELRGWPDEAAAAPLFCGITRKGSEGFDLAVGGSSRTGEVLDRWAALRRVVGARLAVVARQPHGTQLRFHDVAAEGLLVTADCDGHLTRDRGVLLGVTVADCVPIFLAAPSAGAVAVVHAGWRGAAEGVLERAVVLFRERLGIDPDALHAHFGPSICGVCYEVGGEVHDALDLPRPSAPEPVDLRAWLGGRALDLGLAKERVSRSAHCTLCGDLALYSHRGGDAGRQVAYIGLAVG